MFAKQLPPDRQESTAKEIQFPYTCPKPRCGKPASNPIMCDECWDKCDPSKKQDNLAWWESPKKKAKKHRGAGRQAWLDEQKAKKDAQSFTELAQRFYDPSGDGAPGHMARYLHLVAQFAEGEKRRLTRLDWLEDNWQRVVDVERWRKSLVEQDAEWRMKLFNQGKALSAYVDRGEHILMDDDYGRGNPMFRTKDFERLGFSGIELLSGITGENGATVISAYITAKNKQSEAEMRQEARNRFFNAVYDLSEKDFALLKVRVHQLRANRDHESEHYYPSEIAANLLSSHTGELVSEDAYRKRLERFNKEFTFDLEIWVNSRYL